MEMGVDWLRENSQLAVSLGLGFVLVKLSDQERLHFYHPDCKVGASENPHDHRYNFRSRVLRGALKNSIWEVREGSGWTMHFDACKAGPHPPGKSPPTCEVDAVLFESFVTREGSGYYLDMDTFHTVTPLHDQGPCITHLYRSDIRKEFARVVVPPGGRLECLLGSQMTEARIWEIVEECLSPHGAV